jgi:recombination protein RecT
MPNAVDTARIRDQMTGAAQAPPGTDTNGNGHGSEQPVTWLSGVVDPIRPLIARALPDNLNPERFVEAVCTELRSLPPESAIKECPEAEVRRGIMRLALLGLEPGPAEHVVLYPIWSSRKKTTELVPRATYKGVMELARRSGKVRAIRANAVYSDEEFDYFFDDRGEHLFHRPLPEPQGELQSFYAVAFATEGGITAAVVLSLAEIDRRRSYSRRADSGAWKDHYDAMARKTAILALGPFLPLTPQQVEVLEGGPASDPLTGPAAIHASTPSSNGEPPTPRIGAEAAPTDGHTDMSDPSGPQEDEPPGVESDTKGRRPESGPRQRQGHQAPASGTERQDALNQWR